MKTKLLILFLIFVDVFIVFHFVIGSANLQLLNPQGPIALAQRNLFLTAIVLMLVVALPIYLLIFIVAYKYRSSNEKAKRDNRPKSGGLHQLWWWIPPTVIILTLASITWGKTHLLDPYRPLDSNVEPIRIQVVSLNWKWLFIYPDENIATINYIQFPENTPVNFELTSLSLRILWHDAIIYYFALNILL